MEVESCFRWRTPYSSDGRVGDSGGVGEVLDAPRLQLMYLVNLLSRM
jgi:hypothetical protein